MWSTLLDEKQHLRLAHEHMDGVRRIVRAERLANALEGQRRNRTAQAVSQVTDSRKGESEADYLDGTLVVSKA